VNAPEPVNPITPHATGHAFGYVECGVLLPHEATVPERLEALRNQLVHEGVLYRPVIVDRDSMVILDGHHRVRILTEMGCALIPVYLVNYGDPEIRVHSRRPEIAVSKQSVVQRGVRREPYPARTSRHEFCESLIPRPTRLDGLR